MKKQKNKPNGYVSEVDTFLKDFISTHKRSESELQEIRKYQRIIHLRDHKETKSD